MELKWRGKAYAVAKLGSTGRMQIPNIFRFNNL
jgi:hypothetical protein